MQYCLYDLRDKEVISSKSACKLGNIYDVRIDDCTGRIISLKITGRSRSLFSKGEDTEIKWDDIEVIGEDTILVGCDLPPETNMKKKGFLEGLFR